MTGRDGPHPYNVFFRSSDEGETMPAYGPEENERLVGIIPDIPLRRLPATSPPIDGERFAAADGTRSRAPDSPLVSTVMGCPSVYPGPIVNVTDLPDEVYFA